MDFNATNISRQPEHGEFELSLFGPGVGECIVIHRGDGSWIVVDSCKSDGQPVAVKYLRALGLPLDRVCALVITHWHDDHIAGAADALNSFTAAQLYCSAALRIDEFRELLASVRTNECDLGTSGVQEFRELLTILHRRNSGGRLRHAPAGPVWLMESQRFINHPDCKIWALSPSSHAMTLAQQALGRLVPSLSEPILRVPDLSPNSLSVVLQLEYTDRCVLLGSDLEVTSDPRLGWQGVIANHSNVTGCSSVFKVAHHGSKNGHHDDIYTLLTDKPDGILTPFRRSRLPGTADLARLQSVCRSVYLTSPATPSKPKPRPGMVERNMNRVASNRIAEIPRMGLIRLRWRTGVPHTLELFGLAHKV